MKKEYTAPKMSCELFAVNEYVAACYDVYCTQTLSEEGMNDHIATSNNPVVIQADSKEDAFRKSGKYLINNEITIGSGGFIAHHSFPYENKSAQCDIYAYPHNDPNHPNASA